MVNQNTLNVTELTFLLNKPDAINMRQTLALEEIINDFPYFQSARALRLKGLYNENSLHYNSALKTTAAYTTERSVLFDFITSDGFVAIQKGLYDQKLEELHQIVVKDFEFVVETARNENSTNINGAISTDENIEESDFAVADEQQHLVSKLEIGKPLDFSRSETHSFQEWLQLSKLTPINRDHESDIEPEVIEDEDPMQKKIDLIDRFIEANPKIPPVSYSTISSFTVEQSKPDNTYLMTETLARVYLEQKKYQKAIQAYEILILKYPEKSSFFADRILDIKNLQQK